MLDDIRGLFWRFTAADDRVELAPKLEALLKTGLERATSTSQKAAWFSASMIATRTKRWRGSNGVEARRDDTRSADGRARRGRLALELAVRDAGRGIDSRDAARALQECRPQARFAFVRRSQPTLGAGSVSTA
jgi:hypothetical protein